MRKIIILTTIITLLTGGFTIMPSLHACTMFKITMYGKTMVGNNEDYWNPNSRIWFEKGGKNEYGAVFVGYDDFWPQGGMNQAGLVFDGFAEDYKAISDTSGKEALNPDFLAKIMKTCATVDQVKTYFSRHNLSGLETAMLFFVDKTGRYLVVEGDSLILGNKKSYIVSNFYPSQTKNECEVPLEYYQNGRKYLADYQDTTIKFCTSMMDTMHQERSWGAGTMYTTIYDLDERIIYLYFFHDYTHVIKFNLDTELSKNDYSIVIPRLFPENRKGQEFWVNYNTVGNELELFGNEDLFNDSLRYNWVVNTLLENNIKIIRAFSGKISKIGDTWMEKGNYKAAIGVFQLEIKVFPDSWEAYDKLAKAFLKNNQEDMALINYNLSLKLNPDNIEAKKTVEKLLNPRK